MSAIGAALVLWSSAAQAGTDLSVLEETAPPAVTATPLPMGAKPRSVSLARVGDTMKHGQAWALILWAGLVAMPLVVNHRYEGASWALTVINGVHWLLVLLVMAGIIGWFGASEAVLS